MNRHFVNYSALPCEPLGAPIRHEPQKPHDGEWKPLRPGYEYRTLAGGATEVRATGITPEALKRYVEPEKKAGDAPVITPLAPSQGDVPEGATHRMSDGTFYRAAGARAEFLVFDGHWRQSAFDANDLDDAELFERLPQPAAPTEWQSGPPPEVGWREIRADWKHVGFHAYWNGIHWCANRRADASPDMRAESFSFSTAFHTEWRGPRLVGADWPEPQQ
jgi:hypothetical protein